jgi:hypothetical protein
MAKAPAEGTWGQLSVLLSHISTMWASGPYQIEVKIRSCNGKEAGLKSFTIASIEAIQVTQAGKVRTLLVRWHEALAARSYLSQGGQGAGEG